MKSYYTCRISVDDYDVQIKKVDPQGKTLDKHSGRLHYEILTKDEKLGEIIEQTRNNLLSDSRQSRLIGEALFNVLFDPGLRDVFVKFYDDVVHQKGQFLRVELEIEEEKAPELAALPWEFMCMPPSFGEVWLSIAPNVVFSRYRWQSSPAKTIQLKNNEKLRIALVVSAPNDLGKVVYEEVQKDLKRLEDEQLEKFELLPLDHRANRKSVDSLLARKPHILHFIGHGRFHQENNQEVGQIALTEDGGNAWWINADSFSQLFTQHRPGVVILQACQGGMQSSSQAFVGVASKVVQQKIPVVVAMQYEVSNSIASRFARLFYEKLGEGEPVDIAVQQGRKEIDYSLKERKHEFATPVLFMRVPNGHLFNWEQEQRLTDEPPQPAESYYIKPGDTLAKIAISAYGDGSLWFKIAQANREVIPDPNWLEPGTKIFIPALDS